MRKALVVLIAVGVLLLGAAVARAIDRTTARSITVATAERLACTDNGWRCNSVITDVLGPYGGSIQWVGHFYVLRSGFGKGQGCSGSVDIGPYGGTHNATISCHDTST